MGEFNPDDHHIYNCGQESLRKTGVPIIVKKKKKKSLKCSTWMKSQKRQQNDLCFQGKPFNITVIQEYILNNNVKEAEVKWFCEDLQDLLKLIPPKKMSFSL